MELEIQYFPDTDTLYIGTVTIANEGYDIADNLTAHSKPDGEVVGVTLEHAAALLEPLLNRSVVRLDELEPAQMLQDEGKPLS